MKKIVIYKNTMKPSGGTERVISNLSKLWIKKYQLILLTKDDKDSFYEMPSNITRMSLYTPMEYNMHNIAQRAISTFVSFLKSRKALKKVMKQIDPDYIYTATPLNAWEICSLGKEYQCKLVISEHGSFYGYNKFWNMIKYNVYPKAYCVSVLNKMDTEIYKSWGCNAIYIPHVITFPAIKKNPLNTKIALNIGRLTNDKRQLLLIDMWCNIKDHMGWKLWIVGDGENKEILKNKIEEKHCGDQIKLISATKEINLIYEQSSLFLFTSSKEGFGMVLLEAMSFGIPCVSFDCPSGPRDIIRDGYNGYLVENSNAVEFQKKIESIISMSSKDYAKLGDGAFNTVKLWDNAKISEQWDNIFS